MRRKRIPTPEIVQQSKEVVLSFYNRDTKTHVDCLADDFTFIGAFDFQYTLTKQDFLDIIQSEMDEAPFVMTDEEFFLVNKNTTTYIVCGKFKLTAPTNQGVNIHTHTRLTIVWNYVGDELKLQHVHGSNAQDIPLYDNQPQNPVKPADPFFQSLTTLPSTGVQEKVAFHTQDGKYRYFLLNEILYLEANLQNTVLYTPTERIPIIGLLMDNSAKLPKTFYRIHKSYLVNTAWVRYLKRYIVTLANERELPISKEKYMDFKRFLKVAHEQ